MEWIEILGNPVEQKSIFKKIQKFTLYDHNLVSKVNEQQKTFTCLLNCKKINRLYTTICQMDGDLKMGQINISCRLFDESHLIHGQWQYQKVELTKFAFRYNERSYRNIYIKTNPINGEVTVTLSFLTGESILQDENRFRQIMTDLCHIVGQESQMIFNTMLEIIFGREANEPYLKSAIKVNPGFPRYMKIEKLLDKIKSLIATSNFYKIRSDISSAHKNRSYFKKIFLNTDKKLITNYKVMQMALLYEPKYNKKYEQTQKKTRDRPVQFIKDYIELQQKNEIEFAKHLNEGIQKQFMTAALESDQIFNIELDQDRGIYNVQVSNNQIFQLVAKSMSAEQFQHELQMLKLIGKRHPNMSFHFIPKNPPKQLTNCMFYLYEEQIPLLTFLRKNSLTISLSTKLHIMTQICSFIQYLHKLSIAYYIQADNLFITRGLEVRIRGFYRSYKVNVWIDAKKEQEKLSPIPNIPTLKLKKQEFISFPYRFINQCDYDNEKSDILSLGVCLYRILMDKFPFDEASVTLEDRVWNKQLWQKMWTVQTEYFLCKGGELVKLIGYLLLRCMDLDCISNRPYVEWLQVIMSQVRTSLNGLY